MLEDLKKAALDAAIKRMLTYGRVNLTDWDGKSTDYVGSKGVNEPVLNVRLNDSKVIPRLVKNASLAVGEAYVNGGIGIDNLPLFFKLVTANSANFRRKSHRLTSSRKSRQRRNIAHHYDVGNDYYRLWLDTWGMIYSCAYFRRESDSLELAQQQKVEHLLRKLRLADGLRVLDIGCGWGHLLVTAAKKYGITGVGVTLSEEQLKYARELAESEGVSDRVEFRLLNYQDLEGEKFDRIISVGMFEHVGEGNYWKYFSKVKELLAPNGLSVLHTITQLTPRSTDAWIDKYIFPGGHLPTVSEIHRELERYGFYAQDLEDLAQHYARTLDEWRKRHQKHRNKIIDMFDERFYRKRDFWLEGSANGFRNGQLGLTQIAFTKGKQQNVPLTREHLYPCDCN